MEPSCGMLTLLSTDCVCHALFPQSPAVVEENEVEEINHAVAALLPVVTYVSSSYRDDGF